MAVVILAIVLGVVAVVAVAALWRVRVLTRRLAAAVARADGAEAKVAAGLEREAALEERHQQMTAERRRFEESIAELEGERSRLKRSLDEGSGEVQRLRSDLSHRADELAVAQGAARVAEAAAAAAVAQADASHEELVEARGEAERLRLELEAARDEARVAAEGSAIGGPAPAVGLVDALWAFERGRSTRTWRQSVASDPTGAGPFAEGADPARAALEVEAAALREDAGAVLGTEWRLDDPLPASTGLLVVRAGQELLAAASRTVDEAVLVVERDTDAVVLSLCGPDGEAIGLTEVVDGAGLPGLAPDDTSLRVPLGG